MHKKLIVVGVLLILFSLLMSFLDASGYWGYPKTFFEAFAKVRGDEPSLGFFLYAIAGFALVVLSLIFPSRRLSAATQPSQKKVSETSALSVAKAPARLETPKDRRGLISTDKLAGVVLLSLGGVGIVLSAQYESIVLAFIGLTLTFWGCLMMFLLHGRSVADEVVSHIVSSSLSTLDQLIDSSNLRGKAVYIPVSKDSYLPYIGMKNEFVYVPRRDVGTKSAIEEAFMRNPDGLRITPPGKGLADIIEKKSKVEYYSADLNSLADDLPIVMTRDLELAEDVKLNVEGNNVEAKIKKPVCEDLCKEENKLQNICPHIGCPLSSSIACSLTRVTHRPVTIEKCTLKNGTIETIFHIMKD